VLNLSLSVLQFTSWTASGVRKLVGPARVMILHHCQLRMAMSLHKGNQYQHKLLRIAVIRGAGLLLKHVGHLRMSKVCRACVLFGPGLYSDSTFLRVLTSLLHLVSPTKHTGLATLMTPSPSWVSAAKRIQKCWDWLPLLLIPGISLLRRWRLCNDQTLKKYTMIEDELPTLLAAKEMRNKIKIKVKIELYGTHRRDEKSAPIRRKRLIVP
jgi:hypothetical protein